MKYPSYFQRLRCHLGFHPELGWPRLVGNHHLQTCTYCGRQVESKIPFPSRIPPSNSRPNPIPNSIPSSRSLTPGNGDGRISLISHAELSRLKN